MRARPRLLDLFCCQGGAAAGYDAAGFDVTGVDFRSMPRYPYRFVRGDALAYVAEHGGEFDAIHASPPCQAHTALRSRIPVEGPQLFAMATHPDLVPATRAALTATGRPWIIENVPGAPLRDPVVLCGSMFGLDAVCGDGVVRQLRRHRLFEASFPIAPPGPCSHHGQPVGVYGEGGRQTTGGRYKADTGEAVAALRVPWMDRRGVSQAIPPAYTEHLGRQLSAAVAARS